MASSGSNREVTEVVLPSLHDKPTFEDLCAALESLAIKPSSWSTDNTEESEVENTKDVNDYLLSIISSGLRWLKFDLNENQDTTDPKELIWDLASKRMAERCGRTAMPEMTRIWVIPASTIHPQIDIPIREPPLTGDNLGLKTWGTAFAISKKLEDLGNRFFSHLTEGATNMFTKGNGATLTMPKMRVLELGSGTGLVGITTAAIWKVSVVLTDLPEIQGNLLYNVHQNSSTVNDLGGSISCTVLDWKNEEGALAELAIQDFDVVLAADPLYDDEHPELVTNMMKKYLRYNQNSRGLIAVPLRDKNTKDLVRNLVNLMRTAGFQLSNQGHEIFKDDWVDANEEGVKCWWSIWCWNLPWIM